jgi:hypothetical protein
MRTVPVNQSAGPLREGCEPLCLISIVVLLFGWTFDHSVDGRAEPRGSPHHYTMGGVGQCGDLLITVALENIEAKEGHCSVLLLVLNPLLRPRGSCEGPFTPTRAGIG